MQSFAFAGKHGDQTTIVACEMALEPRPPYSHFGLLVRQIENMILTGVSPYLVERTLLTTGILDAAMRSRFYGGAVVPTPELGISYQPVDGITDTAIAEEPFFRSRDGD